ANRGSDQPPVTAVRSQREEAAKAIDAGRLSFTFGAGCLPGVAGSVDGRTAHLGGALIRSPGTAAEQSDPARAHRVLYRVCAAAVRTQPLDGEPPVAHHLGLADALDLMVITME